LARELKLLNDIESFILNQSILPKALNAVEFQFLQDDIQSVLSDNQNLSTIQVFKATKEGIFLGQSDFAHFCQAEIKCLDGKAQAQRNRLGGNKEIEI
jgi:hypothetical protein